MRRAAAVALLVFLVACESDQSPTIEAGGVEATTSTDAPSTTAPPSTTATSAAAEQQAIELALTGQGSATATLTYDGNELCVRGTTDGVGALIGGHIHAGLEGEAGPIVIDLGITTAGDGPFEGCATVGAEGGVVFVDRPSYYLNLHTAELPDGAVRAQLG